MHAHKTSGALTVSLVLHLIIVFVVGMYLVSQTEQIRDIIGVEILQSKVRLGPQGA